MHDGRVVLHQNDCRDVLRGLADNSIDSVVTDPPYFLTSIVKRFGKDGDILLRRAAGDLLSDIGADLGCGKENVRQLETKARRALCKRMGVVV